MPLKKAELDALCALYKAELQKAYQAKIDALNAKNADKILALTTEKKVYEARLDKCEEQLKKLTGDDLVNPLGYRWDEAAGWVQLRAKLMFTDNYGDMEALIAMAVEEVLK